MNIENSQRYYGEVLGGSGDLRTDACCTMEAPPPAIRAALANVHEEVRARYYGCGLVVPEAIEGAHILDLGSGSGQDAYLLAQLVGEQGSVTGVDATPAQLADRGAAPRLALATGSAMPAPTCASSRATSRSSANSTCPVGHFDVIVSNCVINLVTDKAAVFAAAHRLLKPGGELYFSDVYADRRVPAALLDDPVLHGECLSGALYWGDFDRLAKAAGLCRSTTGEPIVRSGIGDAMQSPTKLDGIAFHSATYRLFKLDGLEPQCEDYGQAVRYRGTVAGAERVFALDAHHLIETGRLFPVCGNTARMLADTRFARHFEFFGDETRHYGVFAGCGTSSPFNGKQGDGNMAACC